MISSSAAFTDGCCCGSSRKNFHQAAAQTTPRIPNIQKLWRHPNLVINARAAGGASAPPMRVPMKMTPCARPRSFAGIHSEKLLETLGKAPASPAPNKNLKLKRDTKFHARPVAIVKADHHSTMRVRTLRGRMVSASHPLGISKN